jgi:hypothetical protein
MIERAKDATMKWLVITALLLSSCTASSQSLGALTVVPTHPTSGLALSWGASPATANTILRWTDANPTPIMFTTAPGATTYTDTTAVANTIYYYQVTNGGMMTNTFMGAVSDPTLPFNCPPAAQSANLGMDRTEAFTAPDGAKVSFTVHVPLVKASVINLTPCNAAPSCDDYTNINNALVATGNGGGGTINLAAGDYYVDSKCATGVYCPNIEITSPVGAPWNDITFAGAGLDANSIPTTHIHLGNSVGGNQIGLVIGITTRTLVKNITLDQDLPNAIPGTVKNVVEASFQGTIGSINAPYAVLTVTGISGAIHPGASFLYDAMGQIGTLAPIISQISGATGGNGAYYIQFSYGPINAIASPIAMTSVPSQRFYVKAGDETYYVPNPMSPPTPLHLDGYNWTNRTYDLRAGSRIGINAGAFNPNFNAAGPDQNQYFWQLSGARNLPDGEQGIMFIKSGGAVNVGVFAVDTTLENVHVYGGGATGLLVPKGSQNLRVSNFKITHTPDSMLRAGERQRYVSLIGDSDANNTFGNIIIENSEIGFVDDDSFYVHGPSGAASTVVSTSEFTSWQGYQLSAAPGGDTVRLYNPSTYALLGYQGATFTNVRCSATANPAQCAALSKTNGYVWDFTLSAPIPALAPYVGLMGPPTASAPYQTPVFGFPTQSGSNLIIRNSCFHDNHGRIFLMANNALLQNNVFGNSYYGPIELSMNQLNPGASYPDGPGASNVIITGNKIIGAVSGATDLASVWNPLSVTNNYPQTGDLAGSIMIYGIPTTGFFATGYPLSNIEISNNFISNAPGLAISMNSVTNAGITGNTIVDANSVPFAPGFDAAYCGGNSQGSQPNGANQPWCLAQIAAQGAIMITRSRNVDYKSTPNTFLGTSSPTGVYADPATVTANMLIGSRFVH